MVRIYFIFYLLCLIPLSSMAQGRIGSVLQELKAEFEEEETKYEVVTDEDGEIQCRVDYDDLYVVHLMTTEESPVRLTYAAPKSFIRLHGMIEYYNNNFVIVSPVEWLKYSSTGIVQIRLLFDENEENIPSFYWTKKEQ